jgi:hypothetical protein
MKKKNGKKTDGEKKEIKIKIDSRIAVILKEYCAEKKVDIKKFLEEAIVEKIEIDDIREEMTLYDDYDTTHYDGIYEMEQAVYDEIEPFVNLKKKH